MLINTKFLIRFIHNIYEIWNAEMQFYILLV